MIPLVGNTKGECARNGLLIGKALADELHEIPALETMCDDQRALEEISAAVRLKNKHVGPPFVGKGASATLLAAIASFPW